MSQRFVIGLLALASLLCAQRRVDPRNSHNRAICVVPLVGAGTAPDPKRPKYAPWPVSQDPNGIIAFYFEPTDDGKSAVVEFVAQTRARCNRCSTIGRSRRSRKESLPGPRLRPQSRQSARILAWKHLGW